ncbi:hypothetical protein [Salarchaeum sp. JOR-1]|uniref:DUF7529 family protein n=1 Tax=Salarchaeum sp. JOR-1 TaxID=2599399 RepID=UPI001198310C|nr:hypothetical protein [Salarchaeum sp. JOR-1]QDX40219.1 hypothetical protein FQU85_04655 [Salarchaeum sp. JOR-1]
MVKQGPDSPEKDELAERREQITENPGAKKDAWAQTLADMDALAEELEADGWRTVTLRAGDTATKGLDSNDDPEDDDVRYGIVHVVPDNDAAAFADAFRDDGFPVYDVYRAEVDGRVFFVTELRDPETETAIFIAGNFLRHYAQPLVEAAVEHGRLYTHVQRLDGTHLGSFEHDGYEKFFPEADRVVAEN